MRPRGWAHASARMGTCVRADAPQHPHGHGCPHGRTSFPSPSVFFHTYYRGGGNSSRSPCGCWLLTYNTLDNTWNDTGVNIDAELIRFATLRLVVSDDRLFLASFTPVNRFGYPSTERLCLAEVVLQVKPAQVLFPINVDNRQVGGGAVQVFGFKKSLVVIMPRTTMLAVYDLVTSVWSQLPQSQGCHKGRSWRIITVRTSMSSGRVRTSTRVGIYPADAILSADGFFPSADAVKTASTTPVTPRGCDHASARTWCVSAEAKTRPRGYGCPHGRTSLPSPPPSPSLPSPFSFPPLCCPRGRKKKN
jgi:hypothetical protein